MNVVEKFIRADDTRPSRFHCSNGRLVGFRGFLLLPASVITWLGYKLFRYRPLAPWWVWQSIWFIRKHVNRNDLILEDGSGMSTLWMAARCRSIVSVETSDVWRKLVMDRAKAMGLSNIEIHLGDSINCFADLLAKFTSNVVVIDGPGDRRKLFDIVLQKGSPRLIIYDNSDRQQDIGIVKIAKEAGYVGYVFIGFSPTSLHASQTTVFLRVE